MRLTSLWKGLAIAATLFLIGTEAFAQLPVRTQRLQMLGTTSGTLTFDTPATITSYTVTWPDDAAAFVADGDQSVLIGTRIAANDIDLSWRAISGDLVDGTGTTGFVAWWSDANTLTYTNNFAWTGTALNIGTQNGTAAGDINLGNGAATAVTNFQASGTSGTLTLGSAAEDGTIVLQDGDGETATIDPGDQAANTNFIFDSPTGGGNVYLTPSTNQAGAGTSGYIYVSNGNGTGTWVINPNTGMERGLANPTDGAYSYAVTGLTATPDATDMIIVSSVDITATPTGNLLSVTAVAANSFTVSASGPFTSTERIAWFFIPLDRKSVV